MVNKIINKTTFPSIYLLLQQINARNINWVFPEHKLIMVRSKRAFAERDCLFVRLLKGGKLRLSYE